MKILFDHNVPRRLRRSLIGHDVRTAKGMTWQQLENGALLAAAEAAGFDLMITCDQNIAYQQNLTERKLALLLLGTNNWNMLKTSLGPIRIAVENTRPASFHHVEPA